MNRKRFLELTGFTGVLLSTNAFGKKIAGNKPVVLSTWAPNIKANKAAWEILSKGHVLNRTIKSIDYSKLTDLLNKLTPDEIDQLHQFSQATPLSADCLLNALDNPSRPKELIVFLHKFQKGF